MKKCIFWAVLVLPIFCTAQSKRGNVWAMSETYWDPGSPGYWMDFNSGTLEIKPYGYAANIAQDQSFICDTSGQLLFYSNACAIWTKDNVPVPGSEGLNPGGLREDCPYYGYLGDMQLFLPYPEHPDQYMLIHHALDKNNLRYRMYYSVVEHRKDDVDTMLAANIPLDTTRLLSRFITATPHGNGRDWWVLHTGGNNLYYWYLLSPNGIVLDHTQVIGSDPGFSGGNGSNGQAAFSPDGSKFVMGSSLYGIDVMDVDRCEGLFSNLINVVCETDSFEIDAAGVSFSPTSRFLYVTSITSMHQFDMWAPDWPATKTLVSYYDGFVGFFPATLGQLISAPDQKMYFGSTFGIPYLGVIHNPDVAGVGCNVEQHALHLPFSWGFFVPNVPYFDAGILPACAFPTYENSPTDQIYAASNLTFGESTIHIPDWQQADAGQLLLTNTLGQVLYQADVIASDIILDLQTLPDGTYFCFVRTGKKNYKSCKIVVAKQ